MKSRLFLSLLLCLPLALQAEESERKPAAISVRKLPSLPLEAHAGQQFLRADKKGRVFLLREVTLDVYQLSAQGELVPQGRLFDPAAELPPITEAALSLDGGTWVLFAFPNRLYIVQGGRDQHLEAPWMISSVAAVGGEPFVAVTAAEMGTAAPTSLRLEAPPLLQNWDGKRWNTLAHGRYTNERPPGVSFMEEMRGEFSVFLAPTPERHFWMANEYSYRLRHFSPSGILKDELVVGEGKVTWRGRTDEEWEKSSATARRLGLPFNRGSLSAVKAEDVIRTMTVGRDGQIYLVVQTEKGLALDRFHPTLLTLERVSLGTLDLGSGRVTMAAGTQGLYIAGRGGRRGLWHITSEALELADWQPVEGAVLNGQPLTPPPS